MQVEEDDREIALQVGLLVDGEGDLSLLDRARGGGPLAHPVRAKDRAEGDRSVRTEALDAMATGEWDLAPGRWQGTELLLWKAPDAWFSINAFYTAAGLRNWYVNFEHPTTRTGNRFDAFDIVSRSSGVVHHPNRLSGGEKFLASLALAPALAELYSRSGPSLGSLFLDDGFAVLDTILDPALEVMRVQAGGNRLVMVISHLHAVAEVVDDVLWVEWTNTGSSARWLPPAERDEMALTGIKRAGASMTFTYWVTEVARRL